MSSGKAKFFCENCGSEVPENSKVCKTCGKFFISVRCPKCGATGSHDDFEDGCPKCGYAMDGKKRKVKTPEKKPKSSGFLKNGRNSGSHGGRISGHDSSLPLWVYAVTFIVLSVVLFAVYSCIKNP